MSEVKFSANPSAVLRALADIRRELDRTGQAGRKLSEIDFGFPSLGKLEDDMRRLQTQLDAFRRIAPNANLSRGLRNSGQADTPPWAIDWSRAFPSEQQRRQAQARLSQLPAAFAGAPISGNATQAKAGGLPAWIPQTPAAAVGSLVGLALGGSLAKAISDGVGRAREHDQSADTAMRWSTVTRDFETLRTEIGAAGKGFGLMAHESAKLAVSFAAASGNMDTAAAGARVAIGIAAGYGMETAPTVRRFGEMERFGAIGAQSATSMREFAGILSETITRGGMNARGEQVLDDLAGSVERLSAQTASPQNVATLAGFNLASYQQMQENPALRAVGVQGMMGAIGNVTQWNGNDLETSMLQYNALADFTSDPFLQRRMIDAGPFSRPGEMVNSDDKRTLFEIMADELKEITSGMSDDAVSSVVANYLGTNTILADEIMEVRKKFADIDFTDLNARLKASGFDLESMNPGGFSQAARVLAAKDNPAELAAIVEQTIKSANMDDAQAAALRGKTGDELVNALIGASASEGRVKSPHTELTEAIAKLGDDFAVLGNELNQAKTDLTKGMADLTTPLVRLAGIYDDIKGFRKEHVPDMEAAGLPAGTEVFGAWAGTGASWWTKYRQWQSDTFAPSKGGRSGRNRRTGKPQEAEEAPADDSGSPLLDFFFAPAEAKSLPFPSAFDINPPMTPGQRAQRAMTAPKSVAQSASGTYPFQAEIQAAAKKHGVPEWALASIISQESAFNPQAVGDNDSSWGMGQFNEHGAAADFGLTKEEILAMSPAEQIDDIGEFLKMKLKQSKGDIDRAIELYNGGGDPNYRQNVEARRRELGFNRVQLGSPLSDVDVTSQFGSRKHPLTGKVQSHNGVDLAAAEGTPIFAPADGTVARSGFQKGKAGYYSVLDHGDGTQSKFFHLQEAAADAGTAYKKGDVIGRTGNTGGSTGPHLHYELWRDGKAVDPMKDAMMDWSKVPDTLPKEIAPPGDQVSQRIGTSVRQDPSPPVSLSLNLFQNPVTGAMHVEADREGSGAVRVAYGSGSWAQTRPRSTA